MEDIVLAVNAESVLFNQGNIRTSQAMYIAFSSKQPQGTKVGSAWKLPKCIHVIETYLQFMEEILMAVINPALV